MSSIPGESYSPSLMDLPDEMLLLILKQLDLRDHIELYETCKRLRRLLRERNLVSTKMAFSCNSKYGAQSVNRLLLSDLAHLITYVDLKLVPGLLKSKVIPVLKRMTNLETLDLSYTDIDLVDFRNFGKSHKISHIAINAKTPIRNAICGVLVFLNRMESIHLVSLSNKSHLVTLFCGAVEREFDKLKQVTWTTPGQQMSINVPANLQSMSKWVGITFSLNLELMQGFLLGYFDADWEYVIMLNFEANPSLFMSPNLHRTYRNSVFFPFWVSTTTPELVSVLHNHREWTGHMWHKSLVELNPQFYDEVMRELGKKFIHFGCYDPLITNVIKMDQGSSSSYYLSSCNFDRLDEVRPPDKKRKSNCKCILFNIDKHVKHTDEIKVILGSECLCHVPRRVTGAFGGTLGFDPTCTVAANITYINLHNVTMVDCSFFKLLFERSEKLKTLNIDNAVETTVCKYLSTVITLAKSLVNLRVKEPNITFATFYERLSLCKTLENVHLCDLATKMNDIPDKWVVNVIDKCDKLYSFAFYGKFKSAVSHFRLKSIMRAATARKKNIALNVNLVDVPTLKNYEEAILCDGYADVFFLTSSYKTFNVNLNQ